MCPLCWSCFGSYDFRFYLFQIATCHLIREKALVEHFSGVLQCVIKVDQKVLCFSLIKIWGDKKHPNHRPNQQSPCWTWELIKTLCFVSPSSRWHCQNFHKILLPYLSYWGGGFQWPFLICWSVYQRSHFALWSALSSLPRRFCAYLGAVQRRVLPRWWRWRCWWQWWCLLLILWWLYNVDPEVLRVWKFVSLNLACSYLVC